MLGVRDLFRIGIGPSSSHTVGPMRAAHAFASTLRASTFARIRCDLLGSLAWTGTGHATDTAVVLGLAGFLPDTIEPEQIDRVVEQARNDRSLIVAGRAIAFDPETDIVFDRDSETPVHPNTLRFSAFDADGAVVVSERWCSIGGGFIVPEDRVGDATLEEDEAPPPFPFRRAEELLADRKSVV